MMANDINFANENKKFNNIKTEDYEKVNVNNGNADDDSHLRHRNDIP
jgi:hypothetical protein